MSIKRVNRIAADGTTVTTTFGRHRIAALKASYGDKLETETLNEMGSQSIDARSPGKYSTDEFTITFEYVTFRERVSPLLQKDGFGNEKIPIVVGTFHPDLGSDSDLLDRCRFVGQKENPENTATPRSVECTFTVDQIYWGESRKTRNKLRPDLPLAASKF